MVGWVRVRGRIRVGEAGLELGSRSGLRLGLVSWGNWREKAVVGLVRFQNADGEVQNSCLLLGFIFIQSVYPLGPFGLHTQTPEPLHWG